MFSCFIQTTTYLNTCFFIMFTNASFCFGNQHFHGYPHTISDSYYLSLLPDLFQDCFLVSEYLIESHRYLYLMLPSIVQLADEMRQTDTDCVHTYVMYVYHVLLFASYNRCKILQISVCTQAPTYFVNNLSKQFSSDRSFYWSLFDFV